MNQSTNRSVISRKAGIAHWRVPAIVKQEVLRFLEELALGKVNGDFKVSEARQAKYLDLLRQPLEFFNKKTEQLKVADVERFEQALTTDQLISRRKRKPYVFATKADMRKLFKIYLRWRLTDCEKASTGPVHATLSSLSASRIFTAARNAAAGSGGCVTRCLTTASTGPAPQLLDNRQTKPRNPPLHVVTGSCVALD